MERLKLSSNKLFGLINRLVFLPVIFLLLLGFNLAIYAADSLGDSELVVLSLNHVGPTKALIYKKDTSNSDINKLLRETPEFIEQVRKYQELQRKNFESGLRGNFPMLGESQIKKMLDNYKPEPAYIVLNPNGEIEGVSFANKKPFGILETDANGKTSISLKFAPFITLSADTINEIKTGDRWGYETFCHEMGHVIMYPTNGMVMYPRGISENIIESLKKEGHWKSKVTTAEFAFLEGWAEFNGSFFTNQDITADYTKKDGVLKTADEMSRTEGLCAQLLLNIANDKQINPDRDKAYQKMVDSMTKHKPTTFNSFLVNYIKDNPSEKEAIEKIMSDTTGGVLKINYNSGIKEWWANFKANTKNVWSTFKTFISEKFNKKDKAAVQGATAPVKTAEDNMQAVSAGNSNLTEPDNNGVNNLSADDILKLTQRQKALFDEYKKALETDNNRKADEILKELTEINEKLKK